MGKRGLQARNGRTSQLLQRAQVQQLSDRIIHAGVTTCDLHGTVADGDDGEKELCSIDIQRWIIDQLNRVAHVEQTTEER